MRIACRMNVLLHPAAALLMTGAAAAATDLWDLPPLRYSDTPSNDAMARLLKDQANNTLPFKHSTPLETLRGLLQYLNIPESSQILVFSKTSKQQSLISPANPRCLFFNEDSYVGYVPGGKIEIITQDPLLGPVFHLLDPSGTKPPEITRDNSECLSCHGTARTESVPGVLVRSVFPDKKGSPIPAPGSFLTDHTSPVGERWGGYYVTGNISLPHLGNQMFRSTDTHFPPSDAHRLDSLETVIDVSRYPARTSDIVALMVLEHQCRVQNIMNSATVQYKRIQWLQSSLSLTKTDTSKPADSATRFANDAARQITDLLLFKDEASLGGDGIEGNPIYQEEFTRRFPKTADGRSLADFQLNDRIFKHRCSYMVYSSAFRSLPDIIRSAVLHRLREILNSAPSPGNHPSIQPSERKKIDSILRETLPGYTA